MTDADIRTLKGIVSALSALRNSGTEIPTHAQAEEFRALGENVATDALLCVLGVAVLAADHGASYLGYMTIRMAAMLAESHPDMPTPSAVLRTLATIADATASKPLPKVTSSNKSDQGKN